MTKEPRMQIASASYMSLDGVVQQPELWTFDYRGDDITQATIDQLRGAEALIMGRQTYDVFAGHWPAVTDDMGFADQMNGMPKYVLSNTLEDPTWTNTTVLGGDGVVDRVRELRARPGGTILQYGYGSVTRLLLEHGLLDELRIWLHPVLVGDRPAGDLISAVGAQAVFELSDLQRYDSGVVVLTYRSRQTDSSAA
jgi:dihydrofolate reductase